MKAIFLSFSITNSSLTDYFLELCDKLRDDYQVIVITDRQEVHPFHISDQIKIYQWQSKRPTGLKDFLFLTKLILKYKPVTMIAMFGSMNIFLITGYLLRVRNRIAWCRSLYVKSGLSKKKDERKKIIYRLATYVYANSNATRLDLMQNFSVEQKKIKVFYNAVRTPDINSVTVNPNKIIYVGRLDPAKGINTLIDAMPIVLKHFPETQLTVIGGLLHGKNIKIYQQRIADLKLGSSIFLVGERTQQEVAEAFSESSFSIVPSFLEAFGFVVIESFSVGTPVIGSNSSGIAEIIRHGTDGLLFEPGNHHDLADKMMLLLNDNALREEFGRNCHQRFTDNFEIQKATDELSLEVKRLG